MGSGSEPHQIPSPSIPAPLPSAGNARNSWRREDCSSWLHQHTETGVGGRVRAAPSASNIQESQIPQHSNCPPSRNEKHPKQPG